VGVQAGCEDLNVKLVILVGMYAEVLNLIERNRLIFGRRNVGRRVVFWICAEGADIYLASRDGTVWVDLREISQ